MRTGSPQLRPLTGGAVRAGASTAVTAVTGALTTLALARILGPAGAGVYAIALSLQLGLLALSNFGLQTGISYLVGGGMWSADRAFASSQLAAAVLGVLAIAAGMGFRELVPAAFGGLDDGAALVTVAAVPFALSWTFASFVALALDHYDVYAVPPALQSTLALVGVPAAGAVWGVDAAIAALAASHAITAGYTALRTRRLLRATAAQREDTAGLREAIAFGLKTHVSNVLAFLNYRADMFILNAYASEATVGRYAIAVSITSGVWLLPRALSALVVPRVARLSAGSADEDEAHRHMVETKTIRHTVLLVIGSSLAAAVLLVVIVLVVLGSEFRESIGLGLILLPGTALLGVAGALAAIIVGRGRPMLTLWGTVIVTPPTLALYFVLVPTLGGVGAALASTLSYAFGFVVSIPLYRRATGHSVVPSLMPGRDELEDYRGLLGRLTRARRRPDP